MRARVWVGNVFFAELSVAFYAPVSHTDAMSVFESCCDRVCSCMILCLEKCRCVYMRCMLAWFAYKCVFRFCVYAMICVYCMVRLDLLFWCFVSASSCLALNCMLG